MHFQHLEFLPISQDDVGHVSFSAPVLNSSGKCAGLQQIVEGLSEAESFGRRVLGHEMTCWLQMRGSWNSGTPWYPKLSSISIVFSSNYPATKGYPMTMEPEEFLRNRNFFDAPWLCRNRISSRFTEENFDCFMKTTNDCWTQLSKKHEIRGSFTFFFSGETWGLNDLHLYTIVRVWSWPSDIIWTISGEFLSVPWCDFLSHRSYTLRGWTNRCFWEKGQIAVFKGISSNGYLRPSWSAPKLLRDSEVPRPGGH